MIKIHFFISKDKKDQGFMFSVPAVVLLWQPVDKAVCSQENSRVSSETTTAKSEASLPIQQSVLLLQCHRYNQIPLHLRLLQ